MDIGPVRTFGAIPPTTASRAPPVHEATGGYAVRCPSLSVIYTMKKEMTDRSSLIDICQKILSEFFSDVVMITLAAVAGNQFSEESGKEKLEAKKNSYKREVKEWLLCNRTEC